MQNELSNEQIDQQIEQLAALKQQRQAEAEAFQNRSAVLDELQADMQAELQELQGRFEFLQHRMATLFAEKRQALAQEMGITLPSPPAAETEQANIDPIRRPLEHGHEAAGHP